MERLFVLKDKPLIKGNVLYWMTREQRVEDNWALLYALEKANQFQSELIVLFTIANDFPKVNSRQYSFMLEGLLEIANNLQQLGIKFNLLFSQDVIADIALSIDRYKATLLVTDFDPLREKQNFINRIIKKINIPFYEIDAHNILPCRRISPKKEYGAYTLRPKINKMLDFYFFDTPPKLVSKNNVIDNISQFANVSNQITKSTPILQAKKDMMHFITYRLVNYDKRNNPLENATSLLSKYLHFGQLSAQRLAIEVSRSKVPQEIQDDFLEELIVRKELADNFCLYEKNYDNFNCFPDWAQKTLIEHKDDKRDYLYSLQQFEEATTHEDFWNAIQQQLINTGYLNGYLRMYWAKKVLEWTASPEEAMHYLIKLNDKYQLDGNDPNGYTGIAWSVGGVHDRAWSEREVFGKIRYMNLNGAKRKFDVDKYIQMVPLCN
jgi:deoxyribodipyrimidine photo-lyase